MIDETALKGYYDSDSIESVRKIDYDAIALQCLALLIKSRKPLLLIGNGVSLSKTGKTAFDSLLNTLPVPLETTWKSIDLIAENHPLYMGHPGIMGDRGANFILQEADLLISVGSRLDTSLTAFDERNFAKNAKKIIIDIDANEIARMNMEIDLSLVGDAGLFLSAFARAIRDAESRLPVEQWREWIAYGKRLRAKYPVVTDAHRKKTDAVSPYYFIDLLSDALTPQDVIVPESSGGAGEITYQAFRLKKGQKMKNAAALGSMGFGLPYAIGSCVANHGQRTILINGDGAFQLNIQELETLRRLNLPVKIFIWVNDGYASIRSMQDQNFGRRVGSGPDSGYTVPDVCAIAAAYGLRIFRARDNQELERVLPEVLAASGPVLCAVHTDPAETVSPRVKAFPQPDGTMISGKLEAMWPPL